MTESDDRETKSESSKTPDSGQVWLPPRLRDKLSDPAGGDDDDSLKPKSSPVGPIVMFAAVAALVGGVVWMMHNSQEKAKAEAARVAAAARAEVVAESLGVVHRADSLAAVARADSIAFASLPKAQQRKILAAKAKRAAAASTASAETKPAKETSSASAASKPATAGSSAAAASTKPASRAADSTAAEPRAVKEVGPFALDAGQFLDQTRANTVADVLKAKVGLAVQVVSEADGTYHILLGHYSSRAAAEAKANALLAKSLVEQAEVVPLPKSK